MNNEKVWSAQQTPIFEEFKSGRRNFLVEARAGTGKTTTIQHGIGLAPELKKCYMAFNKKNVIEAKSKITDPTCQVMSLNGLGHRFVIQNWKGAKPDDSVEMDRINAACRLVKGAAKFTHRGDVPTQVIKQIISFTKNTSPFASKVEEITKVAEVRGLFIDQRFEDMGWTTDLVSEVVLKALELAKTFDRQMRITFEDQIWLPVVMSWARPWFDLVVVDECQDMNFTQLTLARRACKSRGRMVMVGDARQCVASGTLISTPSGPVPVERLLVGTSVMSYRNGAITPQKVAAVVPTGTKKCVEVTTSSGKILTMSQDHRLYASKLDVRPNQMLVYLMYRQDLGFRVGITNHGSNNNKLNRFGNRMNSERGDRLWGLKLVNSRDEALYWELKYSLQYGIPTLVFNGSQRGLNQTRINRIFHDFGHNGHTLLNDIGYSFDYPHWMQRSATYKRTVVNFSAHGIKGSSVSVEGYLDISLLQKNNIDYVAAKATGHTPRYRVRKWFTSHAKAESFAAHLGRVLEAPVVTKLGSSLLTTAGSLLPGMQVKTETATGLVSDEVVAVRIVEAHCYDIEVDDSNNFFASGILTHNCIYGFRGAEVGGMDRMKKELNAVAYPLTVTYRCPKSIVNLAKVLVPDYVAHESAPEGSISEVSELTLAQAIKPGDAVLSRTNAPLMQHCLAAIRANIPAYIEGRDVGMTLLAIHDKVKGGCSNVQDYAHRLDSWGADRIGRLVGDPDSDAFKSAIQTVEDQVMTLTALADDVSAVSEIETKLRSIFDDTDKGTRKLSVVFSSVHKAKGMEWGKVFLIRDTFKACSWSATVSENNNIAYVAVTRAKSNLVWVNKGKKV